MVITTHGAQRQRCLVEKTVLVTHLATPMLQKVSARKVGNYQQVLLTQDHSRAFMITIQIMRPIAIGLRIRLFPIITAPVLDIVVDVLA